MSGQIASFQELVTPAGAAESRRLMCRRTEAVLSGLVRSGQVCYRRVPQIDIMRRLLSKRMGPKGRLGRRGRGALPETE